MAQKAAKSLAARNSAKLRQTHLITLTIHAAFILLAFTLRSSLRLKPYVLLSLPALGLEAFLDRASRPRYSPDGTTLQRAGDDLDAKGLTEYFWDIIYWTWINLVLVILLGNRGWWLYLAVPLYTIYSAVTTASGLRGMLGGMQGAAGESSAAAQSKRQQKLEKRGGQKVAYR